MKVLVYAPELCDARLGCEETCARTWFKEANHQKSAIRILEVERQPRSAVEAAPPGTNGAALRGRPEGQHAANICTQCGQCIDVCPTLAIQRDKRGVVRIDKDLCVGCLSCVGFCPYGAMRIHPDHTVPFKCVACGSCAKTCPTGALAVLDLPDAPATVTEKRLKGAA